MATARRPDQKVRIRRTAARLFAEKGYDATGIQELSEAVGLGRGALYHHIGSKEQLLFEIINAVVIDVVAEAEAIRDRPIGAEAKFRALMHLHMATVAGNLAEWTVFFRELDGLSGNLRSEVIELRQRFEDVWTVVMAEGVAEGLFRELDPLAIRGILGVNNYAYVWLRPRGRLAPEEIADVFCDLLLAGVRA